MRCFRLCRTEDPTGISGTGVVAEGCVFSDGTVVMRWCTDTPSTVLHESIENVIAIHGHGGATRLQWL